MFRPRRQAVNARALRAFPSTGPFAATDRDRRTARLGRPGSLSVPGRLPAADVRCIHTTPAIRIPTPAERPLAEGT
jgi:hypothetical protein